MKVKLLDSATIRQWTKVHPGLNLFWLALDYLTAAALITGTVYFWNHSSDWGLHFTLNILVGIVAVILIGCVQHRIALMGHEASHYLLHPNRKLNDILAELLCFFPIFGTISQYRAKHLSHHQYPNDPDRDMNMNGDRAKKLYERFPMPKPSFIYNYYVKFFWPPFVLYNLKELLRVATVGSGLSPVPVDPGKGKVSKSGKPQKSYKSASLLGILYMILFVFSIQTTHGKGYAAFFITLGLVYLAGLTVALLLPDSWFPKTGGRLSHSLRLAAVLRLSFITLLLTSLGFSHRVTGVWTGGYFLVLWILPLIYVFPYLMLLREIFQHANADQGDLTNSRIINADPFTQWALLGYGNGDHLIHHIYPNIPQYHLREAHERLLEEAPDYAKLVEETYGFYASSEENQISLLDSLAAEPQQQPS